MSIIAIESDKLIEALCEEMIIMYKRYKTGFIAKQRKTKNYSAVVFSSAESGCGVTNE